MHRALDVIGTLARLGLAAVWLISGGIKAVDPDQTYVAVRAYQVLPSAGVELVAALLPWIEIALGVLLLVGAGIRPVAVASAVLLVVFVAGVVQAGVGAGAVDRLRLLRGWRRGRAGRHDLRRGTPA